MVLFFLCTLSRLLRFITSKFRRFDKRDVRHNSVLVVEPNAYHGCVLPGVARYFGELGYNVDVLCRAEVFLEDPFINFAHTADAPRIFTGNAKQLTEWLLSLTGNEYEYVFFSSPPSEPLMKSANIISRTKANGGVILLRHQVDDSSVVPEGVKSSFALISHHGVPMLNPHYFGEFEPKVYPSKTVKFVAIGEVVGKCKNHRLLIDAADQLVQRGITNFGVSVIGKMHWKDKVKVPRHLKRYIKFTGWLDFERMYAKVNASDFILALLDPTNPEHDRYKESVVTGSLSLSIGFRKPLVVSEPFAAFLGLDRSNSILYPGNSLLEAMSSALHIVESGYSELTKGVSALASRVYQTSLENLRTATLSYVV